MPAHKPEECDLQLLEALKAGDLDDGHSAV